MKNMKSAITSKKLADSVGEFIRYWGFRRIHGQIWTQIYLSRQPLSGADLVKSLDVSKALVSPALSELIDYKLIRQVEGDGRTHRYVAEPQVFDVITKILQTRERVMIETAKANFDQLQKEVRAKADGPIDTERLEKLGEMIQAADFAIQFVVGTAEEDSIGIWSLLDTSKVN